MNLPVNTIITYNRVLALKYSALIKLSRNTGKELGTFRLDYCYVRLPMLGNCYVRLGCRKVKLR